LAIHFRNEKQQITASWSKAVVQGPNPPFRLAVRGIFRQVQKKVGQSAQRTSQTTREAGHRGTQSGIQTREIAKHALPQYYNRADSAQSPVEVANGHTDIEHFDRVVGADFPADLLNQLARIASQLCLKTAENRGRRGNLSEANVTDESEGRKAVN